MKPAAVDKAARKKADAGTRVDIAEFTAAAAKAAQVPPETGPEIAFAGRSNVGKSSLLNMLLARKSLARTSSTPGCTRQIVFFRVVVGGPEPDKKTEMSFVDLPGYGYAKVSKSEAKSWKELLETYLRERRALRAVVLLVDVRRGVEEEERDLLEFLGTRPELAVIVAATKVDKLPRSSQKPALTKLERDAGFRVVATSAETRAGREELWSRILAEVV